MLLEELLQPFTFRAEGFKAMLCRFRAAVEYLGCMWPKDYSAVAVGVVEL